jgi:hypothetical protein
MLTPREDGFHHEYEIVTPNIAVRVWFIGANGQERMEEVVYRAPIAYRGNWMGLVPYLRSKIERKF